jgi:hypothetical protein
MLNEVTISDDRGGPDRRFVKRGGLVIADNEPGPFDQVRLSSSRMSSARVIPWASRERNVMQLGRTIWRERWNLRKLWLRRESHAEVLTAV